MSAALVAELQREIDICWARTGLEHALTVQVARQDDGSPHVEVQAGQYDIVITERGNENDRFAGLSLSQAARWYLFGMACGRAQAQELKDRKTPKNAPLIRGGFEDDGYSRWNWMAPTIETMFLISTEHGNWARAQYAVVLRRAPLEDHEKRNARWPLPPVAGL